MPVLALAVWPSASVVVDGSALATAIFVGAVVQKRVARVRARPAEGQCAAALLDEIARRAGQVLEALVEGRGDGPLDAQRARVVAACWIRTQEHRARGIDGERVRAHAQPSAVDGDAAARRAEARVGRHIHLRPRRHEAAREGVRARQGNRAGPRAGDRQCRPGGFLADVAADGQAATVVDLEAATRVQLYVQRPGRAVLDRQCFRRIFVEQRDGSSPAAVEFQRARGASRRGVGDGRRGPGAEADVLHVQGRPGDGQRTGYG